MKDLIIQEEIQSRIFLIRGQRVMIDRDLASLYGVETKHLNRQVKRNSERFPEEFMFQLTKEEKDELVTNWHRFASMKHSTVLPNVFTEHGVAMLATVLKSDLAVKMSIMIIKAFVHFRVILANHKELAEKLNLLETRIDKHDREIQTIVEAIRQLLQPPEKPKRPIGFRVEELKAKYTVRNRKS